MAEEAPDPQGSLTTPSVPVPSLSASASTSAGGSSEQLFTGCSISEEDLLEPVSLRDPGDAVQSGRHDVPDSDRFPVVFNDTSPSSSQDTPSDTPTVAATTTELDRGIPADMRVGPRLNSVDYVNLSEKTAMPIKPAEFMHLVDSAITGVAESVERLKEMVSAGDAVEDVARSVVDALLAAMGGVDGLDDVGSGSVDDSPPSLILNSHSAVVAAELIPWLPYRGDSGTWMSPRTRMVKGLLCILRACTRNRAMCSASGLLGALLRCAQKIFVNSADTMSWDGRPLCQCIQILAGHSVSVRDLQHWLSLVKETITTDWALQLMLALERAIGGTETRGPACTFEFDGESSGLLGSGESRWPFSNGYSFATWIYIESFEDTLNTATAAAAIAAAAAAKSGKASPMSAAAAASALAGEGTTHMPRLFSFLSSDNHGVEAYFHGQFLVVECCGGRGKKASLHFTHAFKPQRWYFVGLEHTFKQGLMGKTDSELRLYVDGNLYESRPFEFPRIHKPLAFCCIGTNPPPTMAGLQRRRRQCPLFAEVGPVYIFKESIGPERMTRLAARGGDALPCFRNGAGFPCLGVGVQMRSLAAESFNLDTEIAGSLHLLYHPILLSGRFCPDASPSGASGIHRRPAEVLGQVHVASRIRATDSIWALGYGGPMALLPLVVSKVQRYSLEPVLGDFSLSLATAKLSAPIFRIISLSIEHPGNNEEFCRTQGPEVLSRILCHLLQILSTGDLAKSTGISNEEVVAAIVSLCQRQKNNHELKVRLFSTLLLDLKVWSTCNYTLQKKLLSTLADMVFTESLAMHDANALQKLLDGCRRCYWVYREKDSVDTFSLHDATRPLGEVNALVDELLVVIELLVGVASSSLATDDVRQLIAFLIDCPQPNQDLTTRRMIGNQTI